MLFKKKKKEESAEIKLYKEKIEHLKTKEQLKNKKSENAALGASFGILLFLAIFIFISVLL